jgi:LPXTG-motif cell wall-anchored protein
MKNKKAKLALITLLAPTIISTQSVFAEGTTDASAAKTEETQTKESQDKETQSKETKEKEKETQTKESSEQSSEKETEKSEEKTEKPQTEDSQTKDTQEDKQQTTESKSEDTASSTPAANNPEEVNPEEVNPNPLPPVNEEVDAPTISVASAKTLQLNSEFNPLEGVTAYDDKDGDLTSKIKVVSNNVDTSKATATESETGTPYEVVYSVTNSAGKTTTATVSVHVAAENIGFLTVSMPNLTIVQNQDYLPLVEKQIKVTDPYGEAVPADEYLVTVNGSAGGGAPGTYQMTAVVESYTYGTVTEVPFTITVQEGVNLKASDTTILVGDEFDPMSIVSATELLADGTTATLGAYDGSTDVGIYYEGEVDTTKAGVYPITYYAKGQGGVIESKKVNVTVAESVITIDANDVTLNVGDEFDPLDYATATDSKEGELPVKVEENNVDTSKPTNGKPYQVTYSATNSKGEKATKTISVTVNPKKEITPTIEVTDKTMYVGDVLTEDDILGWAKTTNAENLTFEIVAGGPILVTQAGSQLVEKGQYTIQYTATSSDGTTATAQMVLTVKDAEDKNEGTPGSDNNQKTDDPEVINTGKGSNNVGKTVSINSKNKTLPKTGESNNFLLTLSGGSILAAISGWLLFKKRR